MNYFEQHRAWAPAILRIFFGVAFIVAGLDKVLNLAATNSMFQALFSPSLGTPLLYLTIAIELLGGLALLFGFRVRLAAGVLALLIVVAFVKTFQLGASANMIGTLREIMVMNTGGGNTAVNFAYFAALLSLVFSGAESREAPFRSFASLPSAPSAPKKRAASRAKKTKRKKR